MKKLLQRALVCTGWLDRGQDLALLVLRLYLANVFIRAGLTKLMDWSSTLALFHDEYHVPLLPPDLAAVMGTFGETVLPVLLVLGIAGRFAAAGLFVVNAMAVLSYPQLWQFDCPAAVQSHLFWGAGLAVLALFGPGRIALDNVVLRRYGLQ